MIVHLMWGIAGLTLGVCAALLVVKNWEPDWIEATGTWFGGVGTVLTLLWAVRAFRADQSDREKTRVAEYEKDHAGQLAREQAELLQATSVSIALRGGGAYGSVTEQQMTSIHLDIKNYSEHAVVVQSITLDERLKPKHRVPSGFRLAAGEPFYELIEIMDVPARQEELSGRPMSRFSTEMTYRLDGQDWNRSSTSEPRRL